MKDKYPILKLNKRYLYSDNFCVANIHMLFAYGNKKGFIAITAIVILSMMTLVFSLLHLYEANNLLDWFYRKELRIQSNFNAYACRDRSLLLLSNDYFLSGEIEIKEFGCKAKIINNFQGDASIEIITDFRGVISILRNEARFNDNVFYMID